MAKACEMAGGVFLFRAHIEAIERTIGLRLQRRHLRKTDVADAGAIGAVARIGLTARDGADLAAPVGAMLEILLGQSPSDRSVAQRQYLVGYAGICQLLGA